MSPHSEILLWSYKNRGKFAIKVNYNFMIDRNLIQKSITQKLVNFLPQHLRASHRISTYFYIILLRSNRTNPSLDELIAFFLAVSSLRIEIINIISSGINLEEKHNDNKWMSWKINVFGTEKLLVTWKLHFYRSSIQKKLKVKSLQK